MYLKSVSVFSALLFSLFSAVSHAASPFAVPQECKSASLDQGTLDRKPLPLPACVAAGNCGDADAAALTDWLDEASKKIGATFDTVPNYYPGNTQNELCTVLYAVYENIAKLQSVDFAALSPARQKMVTEAAQHLRATADIWHAREGMTASQRSMDKRGDRDRNNRRLDARIAAGKRVGAEDQAIAEAKAQAAQQEAARAADAFAGKLEAYLAGDASQNFIIEGNKYRSNFTLSPGDNFSDLMTLAVALWHEKRAEAAAGDAFTASAKGEFETTAQYEARIVQEKSAFKASASERQAETQAALTQQLRDWVYSLTGGLKLASIVYNADTQAFELATETKNGLMVGHGQVAVPLADAPQTKAVLAAAELFAGFKVSTEGLMLTRLALAAMDESNPANSTFYPVEFQAIRFDLGESEAAAWRTAFYQKRQELAAVEDAKQKAERERIAQVYPYEAQFSCNLGAVYICLGREGSIRIRSGSDAETYTAHDLSGRSDLAVSLKADFDITAQIGSGSGRALTLTITDYVTGKTLYTEEVATPGATLKVSD
ncbi:hypothetical protein [Kordiimonas sp.]|uniref:hypothetical protein n=1 Tax=Kordiimonas sp. TaxID=1970157 RepID=UPI003A918D93